VKILIVEDEFMVAMTLKALIHRLGYEVVGIADDVASAKDQAEQTGPQLALVDIQLARGSSGIDVASELTKLGVVCIFMTGNAVEALLRQGVGRCPQYWQSGDWGRADTGTAARSSTLSSLMGLRSQRGRCR
jgi:response regulator of citrate/malate metabolism